jgi:hypothetical protein
VPLGLTDAIRPSPVAPAPMTPTDVLIGCAIGFDVSKTANDLAAVHTILKRLNESGELRFVARVGTGHQYGTGVDARRARTRHPRFMGENAHEHEAMHATDDDSPPPCRGSACVVRPKRSADGSRIATAILCRGTASGV